MIAKLILLLTIDSSALLISAIAVDLKELSAKAVTDKNEYEGEVTMKSRLADSDKLSFFPLAIDDYFMAIAVLAKGLAVDKVRESLLTTAKVAKYKIPQYFIHTGM